MSTQLTALSRSSPVRGPTRTPRVVSRGFRLRKGQAQVCIDVVELSSRAA